LNVCAAVAEDLQNQAGLGQEGQAKQTYPSVDQVQDRKQNQVRPASSAAMRTWTTSGAFTQSYDFSSHFAHKEALY